ncbi:MAG: class II glutamine amidotransferase [Pyrobaculum sp.]
MYLRRGEYGVFKSTRPIWESFVEPPEGYDVYVLHSRLASVGAVALANTHPIIYGGYAIVHNGTIVKEKLAEDLARVGVDVRTGGSTDTELVLKAFVHLGGGLEALSRVVSLAARHLDPEEPLMNIAIVNLENAETYFYTYRAVEDPHFVPVLRRGEYVAVASEPLDGGDWERLGNGTLVVIKDGEVRLKKLLPSPPL